MQALEIVSQERPNLIITDYHMPEMDGVALVKTLKSQSTRLHPKKKVSILRPF